jgi:uncharacterized protein YycO
MALCSCTYSKTIKYTPIVAALGITTTAITNVYNSQQTKIQDIQEQEAIIKTQESIKSQSSSLFPILTF